MIKILIQSMRATIVLAILTGVVFPTLITAIGQIFFPEKANGSLIRRNDGTVIGSALIGQQFANPQYFHPRPSAAGSGYQGEASSGTNLGPTSLKLFEGSRDDPKTTNVDESFNGVKQLAATYRKDNGLEQSSKIPIDAVTRSGSGLDPDISLENAKIQSARIATVRHMSPDRVLSLVQESTEHRQLGLFGEPRVNVLLLNLALDGKSPAHL
jgi:potassium-transporting ATPase KdpC subunit